MKGNISSRRTKLTSVRDKFPYENKNKQLYLNLQFFIPDTFPTTLWSFFKESPYTGFLQKEKPVHRPGFEPLGGCNPLITTR